MKQYFEVKIEENIVKTYRIEIKDSVGKTLQYIGDNLLVLDRRCDPQRFSIETVALAIHLREDLP